MFLLSRADELRKVVQVNVVSGSFFEKIGSSGVPYTYNGLFFVLSIPEFPNFQIRNLTRYPLEFCLQEKRQMVPVAPAHPSGRNKLRELEESVLFAEPVNSHPAVGLSLEGSVRGNTITN